MRLVVAVLSREIKTALFLALNGIASITIVATATTTGELASYCRVFKPDVVIVEDVLPGRPLQPTLATLSASMPDCRFLLLESGALASAEAIKSETVEVFTDIDQLVAAVPDPGVEAT